MTNLRRMLSRAMRTSPWNDGKEDREWGQVKRRQRRAEERETEQLAADASEPVGSDGLTGAERAECARRWSEGVGSKTLSEPGELSQGVTPAEAPDLP